MSATKFQVGLAAALAVAGTGVVVQEQGIARLQDELAQAPSVETPPMQVVTVSPSDATPPAPTLDELELQRLRAELAALEQAPRPAPDRATLEAALRHSRGQLARNSVRYTPAHPTMLALRDSIAELERMLGADAVVYPVNAVDTPPAPRAKAAPAYPFDMRRKGVPGEVTLDLVINASGEVTDAVAIQTTLADFAPAAEAAVKKWQFSPGMKDGAPVKTNLRLPLLFVTNGPEWF